MKKFPLLIVTLFILSAIAVAQPVAPAALENGKPIERELKAGENHSYTVGLETGQFLDAAVNQRGIDVVVRVFAPDNSKIAEIDSPNGIQGDEPIALEARAAGTYRIEVSPLAEEGNTAGRYEIRINGVLSAEAYAARLAERKRKQQAAIAWLKENAVPVKTVEAGNGFEDLRPLKKVFRDVRFVGLGEETHGTREFFQFKHRMLEFLVREMGFRVFAIEASYSACQNINDYVMGKTDDGAKALDSQGFWTWNTEEVRAMMDWMRTYNAGVPADKKVKFAGFDIQINETGKVKLLEYLKKVAPDRAADTEAFFKTNENGLGYAAFGTDEKSKAAAAKLRELGRQYSELFVFLDLNHSTLAARSSEAEYDQMREYARVILQFIAAYSETGRFELRDRYMADNFRRLVESEPAGTRIVVWAHNGHIAANSFNGQSFGANLRRFYGKDYYALGFSFDHGSFQAMGPKENAPSQFALTQFIVGAAPNDSVDWYLAQVGMKGLVVDFRRAGKNTDAGEWLDSSHPMRSIGSMYYPGTPEQNVFAPTVPGKEFDGLFFIDSTTRARPNPSVKKDR
jgi:erythromycin esterase